MAIRLTCFSCKSDIHADENLAGKEILCPTCQARVTVPSLSSRPLAFRDDWAEESAPPRPGRRAPSGLPRYEGDDADDYDFEPRRDPGRWKGTRIGLEMIFWTFLVIFILLVPMVMISLLISDDLLAVAGRGPGAAPPRPAVTVGLFAIAALGCLVFIAAVVAFIGMCMCCTVPAESGAKGRAITAVVLVIVTFLGFCMFSVITAAVNAQRPQFGELPVSPEVARIVEVLQGLAGALITTMWLLFHRGIATYFRNSSLATSCAWFIMIYLLVTVIRIGLAMVISLENPQAMVNPFQARVFTPLVVVAIAFNAVAGVALFVWFLIIVRQTIRTIHEGDEHLGMAYEE